MANLGEFLNKKVVGFNGFQITVLMIVLAVLAYYLFFARKRQR